MRYNFWELCDWGENRLLMSEFARRGHVYNYFEYEV